MAKLTIGGTRWNTLAPRATCPASLILFLAVLSSTLCVGPTLAQTAACGLTGQMPALPSGPMLRCPTRNATCCSKCEDVALGLSAVTSSFSAIANLVLPGFGNLASGLQFCSLFKGKDMCQFQVEALLCAVHCDADSGRYVWKDGGKVKLKVCPGFAATLFENCNVDIPNLGFLNVILPTAEAWLSTLFVSFVKTLGITDFTIEVGPDNCFMGPTVLPSTPLCCDPFQSANQECPAGTIDTSKLLTFQAGGSANASECSKYAIYIPPASPSLPPPPPTPVLPVPTLPSPAGSPPTTSPSRNLPPLSPPVSPPRPRSSPPPPKSPPLSSYPICPLTGVKPVKPSSPHFRCPQASHASCCTDCTDAVNSLNVVETRLKSVVQQLAPEVAFLVPDISACDLFKGYNDCQFQLEALFCSFTCNPDAGDYFSKTDSGYRLNVCQDFASQLYQSCSAITLSGLSLNIVASDAQAFLNTIVDNVVATLGYKGVKSNITQSACFAGPTLKPIAPLCCDSYSEVSQCPADSIDTSKYSNVIGQPVNSDACSAFSQPPPAIPPAQPPLASNPPPPSVSTPATPPPTEAPRPVPPPQAASPPVLAASPPTPPPVPLPNTPSRSPPFSQPPVVSAPPPSVSPAPPPQPSINRDISTKNAAAVSWDFHLVLLSLVSLTMGVFFR